ncbi:ATP-binding response regulator [Ruixingdingia sedimenti]|uniref:histidine kinase n=1 Tax=Ruixingdingia sedimenti TaxID=3073604 RepID=A0ABU1F569_9RHOB|nr:ATP-binding protein [Xinfangfangia sp. LG-4]MDR5651587.1 ATP-binding protein [Xinfangfangia sp. LG-4]
MPLLAVAAGCAVAAFVLVDGRARLALLAAAGSFLCLVVILRAARALAARRARVFAARAGAVVAEDAAPCFTTDADGQVLYRNRAAVARFGAGGGGQTLVAALGDVFAHPSAVLYRLQSRAANLGAAREDVVTRRGHIRLSVHKVGEAGFLWRLEEMLNRSGGNRGAEGLSLPMLVAGRTGAILFMNEALRRILGGRPRTLDRVFAHLPLQSGQETVVSGIDGPVRALVAEIEGAGERREIYLLPVPGCPAEPLPAADWGGEDLPVALLRLAPTGAILSANRRARDLFGLDPAALPALGDLVEGLGRSLRDWLGDVAEGRMPGRAEVLRLRQPAEERFVQIALHRVESATGAGLMAVASDATALKVLEAQFTQSQKMQAVGQLAGGVAHDFNNLLTAISGHCDLLLLRHDRGDPDYPDLVQIHQNANRAASLVGQLLAFSRKQTLKPERIDIAEALSDLTHLLGRLIGEKVTLDLAPAEDVGPIRADRRQLEQVLINLVVNARDAMPRGGTIRISTRETHLAAPMLRDRAEVPAGDYAVIEVADEGEGIPPDLRAKIFEPFFSTKRPGEGTGLGLSTVYGIVKQTGGFVFVDSGPGQGATFTLYFPINRAEDTPAPAPQPARAAPRQGQGVVLLVEDEAPVRAFASRALRLRGYTVLEADSAEQALETLADPALSVDVFVTDVIMPGMDGPSWVRKALEGRPGVRVVFVSGYAEDTFADAQAEIPNSVFLPKPFSLDDLTTTVQGQLH